MFFVNKTIIIQTYKPWQWNTHKIEKLYGMSEVSKIRHDQGA